MTPKLKPMGKRRRFEYEDDAAKDDTLWLEKSDKEAALFNPVADATSPLTKLHDEILAFCALVAPSAGETRRRDAAVANIEAAVAGVWPKATVHVFGSSLTGLSLPSSDVDVVVFGASGPRRLRALAAELNKRDAATNMEVVESARIPIVKYADKATGIPVDVSFDVESGLRTGRLVRGLMDRMPPLRPLVIVLKFFLAQRGLNETFTGGVGSFMMQMMVVSFLQMRHRTDCATNLASAPNLGALLLEFFELYGKDFNYGATGISVRHHGSYFPKRSRGWDYPQRPQLLALENPDDASLDVGKNSFAMTRVKRAFEHAHAKLSLACCGDDWRAACLLGSAVDATVLNPRVASFSEDAT